MPAEGRQILINFLTILQFASDACNGFRCDRSTNKLPGHLPTHCSVSIRLWWSDWAIARRQALQPNSELSLCQVNLGVTVVLQWSHTLMLNCSAIWRCWWGISTGDHVAASETGSHGRWQCVLTSVLLTSTRTYNQKALKFNKFAGSKSR